MSCPEGVILIFPVPMRPGETPVPIPNTTVKPRAADGTTLETAWESRRAPDQKKSGFIRDHSVPVKLGVMMTDKTSVRRRHMPPVSYLENCIHVKFEKNFQPSLKELLATAVRKCTADQRYSVSRLRRLCSTVQKPFWKQAPKMLFEQHCALAQQHASLG